MSNIGFLSYWGFGRGQAYVTLAYCKMLQEEHDCFILQQDVSNFDYDTEFDEVKVNVTKNPGYFVDEEVFKKWINENNLDAIVFMEYDQWNGLEQKADLPKIAKDLDCKTYGFLVTERFKPEQAARFDKLLAPTVSYQRLMRTLKVRNVVYVPYSLDLKKFDVKEKNNDVFRFYHPGGMIGVAERKNTTSVIKAFVELNMPNSELVVTTQADVKLNNLPDNVKFITENLQHDEIIQHMANAHVTVYPPKWETIGLGILESLAVGTPVITTDAPPMNEFVVASKNGLLVQSKMVSIDGIEVKACEIDYKDIKQKMDMLTNTILLSLMSKNARYIVEQLYDIEKNKKYFLEFLKKDLGEDK